MPFLNSTRGTFGVQGTTLHQQGLLNYFGNGSDGAVTISSNTTLVVPNKNGSYDGDYVVKNYSSLTIDAGQTLTTDQPCKGLFIYVSGNCTINGTISMAAKGAAANPDTFLNANGIRYPFVPATGSYSGSLAAADFGNCGTAITAAVANQLGGSGKRIIQIPKRGANGGASVGCSSSGCQVTGSTGSSGSASGTDTVSITTGGGGAGGIYYDTNSCGGSTSGLASGRGGNGTAFSGGTGGGGKMSGTGVTGSVPSQGDDNGGEGGEGGNGHCGGVHMVTGGVGNPGGWDQYGSSSQGGYNQTVQRANSGTGGVIWLIVGGNLTIGSSGVIDVRGTNNTNYNSNRTGGGNYGNGGASGGGIAILLHKGSYSNSGNIYLGGGVYDIPGTAAGPGGTGGSGASFVSQMA
jgi:hypothetical protein